MGRYLNFNHNSQKHHTRNRASVFIQMNISGTYFGYTRRHHTRNVSTSSFRVPISGIHEKHHTRILPKAISGTSIPEMDTRNPKMGNPYPRHIPENGEKWHRERESPTKFVWDTGIRVPSIRVFRVRVGYGELEFRIPAFGYGIHGFGYGICIINKV